MDISDEENVSPEPQESTHGVDEIKKETLPADNDENTVADTEVGTDEKEVLGAEGPAQVSTKNTEQESTTKGARRKTPTEKETETYPFEYGSICSGLVKYCDRANEEKDAKFKQRFIRFRELAWIWDTLMQDTGLPTIFTKAIESHETYPNQKNYKFSLDQDGKLTVKSENGIKNRGEMKYVTIIVKYETPMYGRSYTFTCSFGDTSKDLCGILHKNMCDGKCEPLNNCRTYSSRIGKFDAPKITCCHETKKIIDQTVAKKFGKQWSGKNDGDRFFSEALEGKHKEREVIDKVKKKRQDQAQANGQEWDFREYLTATIQKMNFAINELQYSKLEAAFKECAEIHYVYCDKVKKEWQEIWDSFLNMACLLYDHLLTFTPMSELPERDSLIPHADHKKCENLIYLITCNACEVRYVGKTKNLLSERYGNADAFTREVHEHFKQEMHTKVFRKLQIVDEISLFLEKEGFVKYVKHNRVELEGIEHLWMKKFKIDKTSDLNTQVKFKYQLKHRDHMSELLRNFVCEHEKIYVPVTKKK